MRRNLEVHQKIGAAMRTLRKSRSLTDAEVAEAMGYGAKGKHNVNRWERGDCGITAERLWAYLGAIGATFADLDRELEPRPKKNRRLSEIARELRLLAERPRG